MTPRHGVFLYENQFLGSTGSAGGCIAKARPAGESGPNASRQAMDGLSAGLGGQPIRPQRSSRRQDRSTLPTKRRFSSFVVTSRHGGYMKIGGAESNPRPGAAPSAPVYTGILSPPRPVNSFWLPPGKPRFRSESETKETSWREAEHFVARGCSVHIHLRNSPQTARSGKCLSTRPIMRIIHHRGNPVPPDGDPRKPIGLDIPADQLMRNSQKTTMIPGSRRRNDTL